MEATTAAASGATSSSAAIVNAAVTAAATVVANSSSSALPPPPPPQPPPSQPPPPPAPLSTSAPPQPFLARTDLPHHRIYDFAKTALIKIFVSPYATVCDLYCGGGADTDKWDEAQIGHYIGIDASSSCITDARETWESQRKPYTAQFLDLDPSSESLEVQLEDKGIPADIVCCLQHLQLCFESEERARSLLRNVAIMLKPGGYFFGITPDSSTIWAKYQKNVEASHSKSIKPNVVPNCIRSENYIITFETEEEKFPLFGKKYNLKFSNDMSSEMHFLVHFPSLIRLAREAGLEYVEIQNLTEFYDDNRLVFGTPTGNLVTGVDADPTFYVHCRRAQFAGMVFGFGANFVDPRGKLLARSFDLLGLYTTFVFQKPDPNAVRPIFTPTSQDGNHTQQEEQQQQPPPPQQEWPGSSWRQQQTLPPEEDRNGHVETGMGIGNVIAESDKGILGPGPADLRFAEPYQ